MWAILPLKQFADAKQRLSLALTPAERRLLCEAMVEDVLSQLIQVDNLDGVLIVSEDPVAKKLAHKYRALIRPEPPHNKAGLNGAVSSAVSYLVERNVNDVMVLHGDLPLVRSRDLTRLVQIHQSTPNARRVTLVADREKQGSNCLLCTPPNVIPFAYGPGSYKQHLVLAEERAAKVMTMEWDSLALDIDYPMDLQEAAQIMVRHTEYQNRYTYKILLESGRLGPLPSMSAAL